MFTYDLIDLLFPQFHVIDLGPLTPVHKVGLVESQGQATGIYN